jgi:RNA polymerase-binding protein DksA
MEASVIRSRLEARLAELGARVARIEQRLRVPGHRDSGEQALESENDEVLERLGEAEIREIAEIRSALRRIDDGSYGSCARCGGEIGAGRLEVLPVTTVCIACAA